MKQYQDKIQELANNCCLFMCYVWTNKPSVTYAEMLKYLALAIEKDYVSETGFVKDADKLIKLVTGKEVQVLMTNINPNKKCIANFVYGRNNHWCCVDENDNIIYNPLEYSNCVANGTIYEYRFW